MSVLTSIIGPLIKSILHPFVRTSSNPPIDALTVFPSFQSRYPEMFRSASWKEHIKFVKPNGTARGQWSSSARMQPLLLANCGPRTASARRDTCSTPPPPRAIIELIWTGHHGQYNHLFHTIPQSHRPSPYRLRYFGRAHTHFISELTGSSMPSTTDHHVTLV